MQDFELNELLRSLPSKAPRADFANDVIGKALASAKQAPTNPGIRPQWAVAAVLLVGIFAFALGQHGLPGADNTVIEPMQSHVVQMTPHEVKQLDLMVVSATDKPNATITVSLADNLELNGYPHMKKLQWQTSLKAGPNKLSLPVNLLSPEDGKISVEINHNGSIKQIEISVDSHNKSDASTQRSLI